MGYTHYYGFKKDPKSIEKGADKFKQAVEATKNCISRLPKYISQTDVHWDADKKEYVKKRKRYPLVLRNGLGHGKPIFNDDKICFNGDAEGKERYYHDTFLLSMDNGHSDFCKTARMPYDVAVCIALLCFKHYFKSDFEFSSDGDIQDGEEGWKQAKKITAEYFYYDNI